jgi:hypothetical protein
MCSRIRGIEPDAVLRTLISLLESYRERFEPAIEHPCWLIVHLRQYAHDLLVQAILRLLRVAFFVPETVCGINECPMLLRSDSHRASPASMMLGRMLNGTIPLEGRRRCRAACAMVRRRLGVVWAPDRIRYYSHLPSLSNEYILFVTLEYISYMSRCIMLPTCYLRCSRSRGAGDG